MKKFQKQIGIQCRTLYLTLRGNTSLYSSKLNELLGAHSGNCLLVDESYFGKKGKKSVGVARQWNGRLGKVDNCQVGVFIALGRYSHINLTDFRLFLPKEWTSDKPRCRRAGIPEQFIETRSKIDLALEMVASAKAQGFNFQWVEADGFYGRDSHFRHTLSAMNLTYMVDIPKDTTLYEMYPINGHTEQQRLFFIF